MDVDIDFADRSKLLKDLLHIPASIIKNNEIKKHNTGVYFQDIPVDPITGCASLTTAQAETYGYFKLDFLNLHIYDKIRNEQHLLELMNRPPLWEILNEPSIVDNLFHLNGNFDIVNKLQPRSLEQLAVVLAIKLPCKRYLIGKSWDEIYKEIWIPNNNGEMQFKKAHSISYAMVIIVQMNLLVEEIEV